MTLASVAFYPFAGLTLAAGAWAVTRSEPREALGWLVVSLMGMAGMFLLLVAPALSAATVAGALAVAVLGGPRRGEERPRAIPGLGSRVVGALLVGAVAFVLLGTVARQYVSYGADLSKHPGFGDARALGSLIFTRWTLAVVGLGLVLGGAMLAVTRALGEVPEDE